MGSRISNIASALVASVVAIAAVTGCERTVGEGEDIRVGPFSIAATVTGATPDEVARALAEEIHGVNDEEVRGWEGDWVLVGFRSLGPDDDPYESRVLRFPNGTVLVEMCNRSHIAESLSYGGHHGVAFPCEFAVTPVGDTGAEVVLLNPESIFGVYFGDLTDTDYSVMAGRLVMIRREMEQLTAAALAGFDAVFPKHDIGPAWTSSEWEAIRQREYSIRFSLDIPSTFTETEELRSEFEAQLASFMLEVLTTPASGEGGCPLPGLSVGDWQSPRNFSLSFPGGSDVKLVEMWSDTYMGNIEGYGAYHAPALPFGAAFWREEGTVQIGLLDAIFLFSVFFSDVSHSGQEELASLGEIINADLIQIVEHSLENFVPTPPIE